MWTLVMPYLWYHDNWVNSYHDYYIKPSKILIIWHSISCIIDLLFSVQADSCKEVKQLPPCTNCHSPRTLRKINLGNHYPLLTEYFYFFFFFLLLFFFYASSSRPHSFFRLLLFFLLLFLLLSSAFFFLLSFFFIFLLS